MMPSHPDPDSHASLLLGQLLCERPASLYLSDEARMRCLAHLQRAEKLVYTEVVKCLSEQLASGALQLAKVKSEITCLNQKILRS